MEIDGEGAPAGRAGGLSARAANRPCALRPTQAAAAPPRRPTTAGARKAPPASSGPRPRPLGARGGRCRRRQRDQLAAARRTASTAAGCGGGVGRALLDDVAEAREKIRQLENVVECQALYEKLGPAQGARALLALALKCSRTPVGLQQDPCTELAGRLEHDFNDETLHAYVYLNLDEHAHASRSLRTLSGGEQAFAALWFALAMWPFGVAAARDGRVRQEHGPHLPRLLAAPPARGLRGR